MARVKVLGGTGFAGTQIVREGLRRGHDVTSYSRSAPAEPIDGARYVLGSLLDDELLAQAVTDADVVVETISARGDMAEQLAGLVDRLIVLADQERVRLGVLGGASSLLVEPGGPVLYELTKDRVPPDVLPEVQTAMALLDALRAAPETLDWFYISPPTEFGAWLPEEVTGSYRLSDDVLLKDADGRSYISASDMAQALLDEIERPAHVRRRFHVAH